LIIIKKGGLQVAFFYFYLKNKAGMKDLILLSAGNILNK